MLDIFSMLLCLYCEPDETLELHSLLSSELENGKTRIHEGIIFCKECKRFYMIKDEILYLSPDHIREKDEELKFLNKWKFDIPEEIIYTARPWSLRNSKK